MLKININRTNGGIKLGRKSKVDKKIVIKLFESGMTYRAIANEVESNEDAIRMVIKRNAPEDLAKRKESRKAKISRCIESNDSIFILEHSHLLSLRDLKEVRDEKSYGILPNESIGDYGFMIMNIQSYKLSKNHKKLVFDESRGKRTYAVPKSY